MKVIKTANQKRGGKKTINILTSSTPIDYTQRLLQAGRKQDDFVMGILRGILKLETRVELKGGKALISQWL